MLAIPAYAGVAHLPTMRAIIADIVGFMQRGDLVTLEDESSQGIITDARAAIVSKFLRSPCTDLVYLDWDVVWEKGALLKLVDHPVDFVGGIYPQRRDPITYSIRTVKEGRVLDADPKTGLCEVAGLHGGFMRLRRHVLEHMVVQYRDRAFERDGQIWVDLFGDYFYISNGQRRKLGEDYAFCQRWRDMGGKVWLDPSIRIGHIGSKMFAGEFGEWASAERAKHERKRDGEGTQEILGMAAAQEGAAAARGEQEPEAVR